MSLESLRNAALGLAARDALTLDIKDDSLHQSIATLVTTSVATGDSVLLLGNSTPGLPEAVERACTNVGASFKLVSSEISRPEKSGNDVPGARMYAATDWCLKLDRNIADRIIDGTQVRSYADLLLMLDRIDSVARATPLVEDASVDVAIVDMVLNRLDPLHSLQLFQECFRVLRRTGILKLVAVVSDEPLEIQKEIEFGHWQARRIPLENEIAQTAADSGFHGMTYSLVQNRPVLTLGGVEVRAVLVDAFKGKQGACYDQGHAVIYRGPWNTVSDDDGHLYRRGERAAVCEKTFGLLSREPYSGSFIAIEPYSPIPLAAAPLFDCNTPSLRPAAVSKGRISVVSRPSIQKTQASGEDCCKDGECC